MLEFKCIPKGYTFKLKDNIIRFDMKVCRYVLWTSSSHGNTGNQTRIPWIPQNSHKDSFIWLRSDVDSHTHSTHEAKHVEF